MKNLLLGETRIVHHKNVAYMISVSLSKKHKSIEKFAAEIQLNHVQSDLQTIVALFCLGEKRVIQTKELRARLIEHENNSALQKLQTNCSLFFDNCALEVYPNKLEIVVEFLTA